MKENLIDKDSESLAITGNPSSSLAEIGGSFDITPHELTNIVNLYKERGKISQIFNILLSMEEELMNY